MFSAQAAATPDAVAIVFDARRITYRELDEQSNKLAHRLRRHGVGPDVPVGLCLGRSPELVAAILAVMKAGGAFVLLEPSLPPAQLAALAAEARPPVLITESRAVERIPRDGRTVLCLDREAAAIAGESPAALDVRVSGENLALILFTSGSTGRPKAVPRLHQAYRFGQWTRSTFQLGESDRHLLKSSLDSSLLPLEVFWPLLTGGRLIIAGVQAKEDTAGLRRLLVDHGITFMALIPSLLRALLQEFGPEACTKLRHVLCFGEPMTADLEECFRRRLPSSSLGILYGTTEAPSLAFRHCRDDGPRPEGNLGYPTHGNEIYILDRWHQLVPIGVQGELCAGGPTLAAGYPGGDERGANRFIPHPFREDPGARLFRTGDRARWRPDGSLEILGRIDDQIKIGGYRIEPAEVEAALVRHPGVREAAVVARPDRDGDDRLVAYLAGRSRGLAVGAVRAHLLSLLPAHMIPSIFVELDRLPRRPNGKLDRRALPSPESGRLESDVAFAATRTPMEATLSPIWSDLLGLERVGIHDDYFELGGTSLKAARLLAAIERACGRHLSLAALYLHPTIARLADLMEASESVESAGSIIALRPGGSRPPLYFTRTMHGGAFVCDPILRSLPPDQPVYAFAYEDTHERERRGSTLEDQALSYCDELIAFQPEGSICLAGYSFGGVLAFEMARQLTTRGRRVVLLAILDVGPDRTMSRVFAYWLILRNLTRWIAFVPFSRHTGGMAGRVRKVLGWLFELLLTSRGRSKRTGPQPSASGRPGSDPTPDDERMLLDYLGALRAHRHGPYPGRVVLFLRHESGHSSIPNRPTWGGATRSWGSSRSSPWRATTIPSCSSPMCIVLPERSGRPWMRPSRRIDRSRRRPTRSRRPRGLRCPEMRPGPPPPVRVDDGDSAGCCCDRHGSAPRPRSTQLIPTIWRLAPEVPRTDRSRRPGRAPPAGCPYTTSLTVSDPWEGGDPAEPPPHAGSPGGSPSRIASIPGFVNQRAPIRAASGPSDRP